MSNTTDLLQQLQAGQITLADCEKKINAKKNKIIFKVTQKGCVGIYGLRTRPIVLYIGELEAMFEAMLNSSYQYSEDFQKFVDDNESTLTRK